MYEIVTKDMAYSVSETQCENIKKVLESENKWIELPNGDIIQKFLILKIKKCPEQDRAKILGSKQDWELKLAQYEKEKSTKKAKTLLKVKT